MTRPSTQRTVSIYYEMGSFAPRNAGVLVMQQLESKIRFCALDGDFSRVDEILEELCNWNCNPYVNNAALRSTYRVRDHLPHWLSLLKHAYELHKDPALFVGLDTDLKKLKVHDAPAERKESD